MNSGSRVIGAIILALGIATSGHYIGSGIKFFRNFDRSVEVKGLAEQNVKSDLATWSINFSVSGDDLKALYQQVSLNQKTVSQFLATNGFAVKDIQLGTISVNDNWANQYGNTNAKLPHYQISNSVSVTTSNVDLVAKVSQNAGELVNQGVIVTNNSISYFYNNLNSIKAQMLDSATQNAKSAAETFAKNTQSQVGKIKSASQGVFTISSPDGSNVGDTSNINKKVRVVTSIQFFLN
ncbi:MAG TPA: SIMPL domain-containing protein [Burkholderiales bacterium]|jgi:hypothetical protein|nr:SIMPL domain-containing protein [Burkholderiales bacterium]